MKAGMGFLDVSRSLRLKSFVLTGCFYAKDLRYSVKTPDRLSEKKD